MDMPQMHFVVVHGWVAKGSKGTKLSLSGKTTNKIGKNEQKATL